MKVSVLSGHQRSPQSFWDDMGAVSQLHWFRLVLANYINPSADCHQPRRTMKNGYRGSAQNPPPLPRSLGC